MRLRIAKKDTITEGDNAVGQVLEIQFKKNKLGAPFKVVRTNLLFGKGFDYHAEYFDIAVSKGIINKRGAWMDWENSLGELVKFQGKLNAVLYLKSDEKELEHIKNLVVTGGGIDKEELPPELQEEETED